ncbi:MAG TPA: oxygenase MpaB family protein [Pseudonocardia sp.]|uniref:oxygenase MpaB family protein n=1 Tax=Pseudonocardia sp. TaxID=60912 RepID=UPI002C5BC9E6|nr:oxygenase MpaB family protein [Pseudonocardia sp.]HTF53733.1 oxygenase MpaB family protein [Pseudonocardia sp.]
MTASTSSSVDLRKLVIGAGLLAGPANVIMQLARPGVGHGVVESTVDSGKVTLHPIKRARTTLSYLAVATLGTDEERAAFRRGVNRSHAQVRSTESSPVPYNAFDVDLQLWVAACLYVGFQDVYRLFGAPVDEVTWERIYRESATLGTTLQVPPERWPADLAAFQRYWNDSMDQVSIDDTVRRYLTDLIMLRHLPPPARLALGRLSRFVTTGFLPERFRAEMQLPWDERRQRRFDRLMSLVAVAVRLAPPVLREFPFNAYLVDLRWRIRTGRQLV